MSHPNPVVVSYGGGQNSTAMLVGMVQRQEPVSLVLFADTGDEKPANRDVSRAAYVERVSDYLVQNNYPPVTTVRWVRKQGIHAGQFRTIEEQCHSHQEMPSLAYGFKGCSVKWKRQPMDSKVRQVYAEHIKNGGKVVRCIGYHNDEWQRGKGLTEDEWQIFRFPLREWAWGPQECRDAIQCAGLPDPGKSACFFCPAMRKVEILRLERDHPDLLERALFIEEHAQARLRESMVKGLGRKWRWSDFIVSEEAEEMRSNGLRDPDRTQMSLFAERIESPCGCYDQDDTEQA